MWAVPFAPVFYFHPPLAELILRPRKFPGLGSPHKNFHVDLCGDGRGSTASAPTARLLHGNVEEGLISWPNGENGQKSTVTTVSDRLNTVEMMNLSNSPGKSTNSRRIPQNGRVVTIGFRESRRAVYRNQFGGHALPGRGLQI